jgi:hypothetical protein
MPREPQVRGEWLRPGTHLGLIDPIAHGVLRRERHRHQHRCHHGWSDQARP